MEVQPFAEANSERRRFRKSWEPEAQFMKYLFTLKDLVKFKSVKETQNCSCEEVELY